jgi:hypothetical protein
MGWRKLVAAGLTVVGAVVCCVPASAATHVANGQLAIQPIAGPGIVLARPDGGGAHRICTDTALCGAPGHPSFSPNGRGIVFTDRASGAVGVVAPDGTCLWCRLGTPLTTSTGSDASFRGNREVTLVASPAHTAASVPLTRAKASSPVHGRVGAIANATTGGLAVVRGPWIYARTGTTGRVSRQVRGTAPSWSPGGRRLAFTRRGWIWTVAVGAGRSRHPTRLTRGNDPNWAPAGGRIAFIAPGHRVATIGTAGRHRRLAGRLRGRSLSWQRRPSGPAPCSAAKGRIVAQSSTSVLRRYAHRGDLDWFGCLRQLGINRHISGGDTDEDTTKLTSGAVAGRFAATTSVFQDHGGDCEGTISVFDDATGGPSAVSGFGSTCVTQAGSIAVDSSGFAAWHEQIDLDESAPGVGVGSLACPSDGLCVGATGDDVIMTTTDPASTDSSWNPTTLPGYPSLGPVQCPTVTLCVIVAQQGASFGVFTSHDPTGGAATWTFTPLPVPPETTIDSGAWLSCPSAAFCTMVVPGQEGTPAYTSDALLTSTDPAGGASAWHASTFPASHYPSGLSCASTSFCALVDFDGDLETTSDPTADDPTWTRSSISADDTALDCPASTLCLTTAADRLYATTDPAAAHPVWRLMQGPTGNAGPGSVVCSSAALCVAFDAGGTGIYTSTDPAHVGSWSASSLPAAGGVPGCTPAGQCVVAIQDGDRALYSADAAAGGGSYTTTPLAIPPACLTIPTCYSESLDVHDDAGTRVADSVGTGAGDRIAGIAMSGNATTVHWTVDGAPRSLQLH